jgi:hypothetical protein
MSRPLAGLAVTFLIALAPIGCHKEAGPPSPEYEQAHQLFSKLYGQQLDDSFLNPQMEQVEVLLAQVPADSQDMQSAKDLQKRITDGRARMEKARKEKEDAIASAHQFDTVATTEPSTPEPPPPLPPPPAPKDAGPANPGPEVGSPASELSSGYLGCFQTMKPITLEGKGLRDAWEMSDQTRCGLAYPSFVAQVLLIEDGKVLAVLPKSAVKVTYQLKDGGTTGGSQ